MEKMHRLLVPYATLHRLEEEEERHMHAEEKILKIVISFFMNHVSLYL
jgi:hypothetical protein